MSAFFPSAQPRATEGHLHSAAPQENLSLQANVVPFAKHLARHWHAMAVTTALANYLQSVAQKKVSAERASIFYALDPVWGAVFANLLLGEKLGVLGWVGSSLIVIAAATNAVRPYF